MQEISFSRIKAYRDCPWLYKLLYLDALRSGPHPFASLGQSLHGALRDYHRPETASEDQEERAASWDRMLECYDANWFHQGFTDPVEQMQCYEKGKEILRNYWEGDLKRRTRIVWVEKEFEFAWEGRKMQGIMDRVDQDERGRYEVLDYKLSRGRRDPQDLQLWIYGFALDRVFGKAPEKLAWLYLESLEKVSLPYDSGKAEALLREALESVKDLRPPYAPNTSHCPACDFRKSCKYSTARD